MWGGELFRLNALLSLLQPLDRYRAPSAILALSLIHAQVGVLKCLAPNRLGGSTVSKTGKEEDDDRDQDFLSKDVLHIHTHGHGPLKSAPEEEKNDDHDQDSLKKCLVHVL